MQYNQILSMQPEIMLDWLEQEFIEKLPVEITTVEDMEQAAKLMLKLSSSYSYLCTLLPRAKIASREYKRAHDQIAYEDMVDRREIIQSVLDVVKQQYAAISRCVGVKIENNKELQMNTNGYIK